MLRILAFLTLTVVAGSAFADEAKHKHSATTSAPGAEAVPDVPNGPLDLPRWMGHAVDNILSGDVAPEKDAAPTRQ